MARVCEKLSTDKGKKMSRVYLVHRDRAFSERCIAALNGRTHIVETFRDRNQAVVEFSRRMPDAVILEISEDILECTQIINTIRAISMVPIILLTASSEEVDEIIGLRLGADVVLRQCSSMPLLSAWIEALIKRHQKFVGADTSIKPLEKILQTEELVMDPSQMATCWHNHEVQLTLGEFKILLALASRPGVIKSREALVELIHRYGEYVDERSVDSYVKRLRVKLREVTPHLDCIQTVYGVGYRYVSTLGPKWSGASSAAFRQMIPKAAVTPLMAGGSV